MTLSERLPYFVQGPVEVECTYQVQQIADYFLLHLRVNAALSIECQRCMSQFTHDYSNETELAVCRDEKAAERLMELYESVVVPGHLLDLSEVLTDELHLSAPNKHHFDCLEQSA